MQMADQQSFVQDPVVAEYYREGFLRELVERQGLQKKAEPTGDTATFASYYGVEKFPPELEQFLRMRDEYEFVYHRLAEWRIFGNEVWLPDPAKGNLFEQVILLDQPNYLGTCILEYSAGCIYLGSAGNGDVYFAAVKPDGNNSEVFFFDHETHALKKPIADSLSSLAYANHLLAMVENSEDDSEDAKLSNIAGAFARIKDRVHLSWHYRSLEETAEIEGTYQGSSDARYYYYRSLWINYLLRNDSVHKLPAVAEAFGYIDQTQITLDLTKTAPNLARLPLTAFYWLWRLFFFNKDETLRQVLEITKASANPVVRDMALLVEELQTGRKELGSIKDIHALREKFLELDLDPDRADERAREQQEAERIAAEKKAADEARAAAMIATLSNEELVETAWREIDNEVIIKPIYDRLRATEAALAADFVRIDFFLKQGFNRNNCFYTCEREDVLEALGRNGDPRLAPLLMNQGGKQLAPVVARMGGQRSLAVIAPMLDQRSEYNHDLREAVQAVGILRVGELAEKLIAMIEEFDFAPEDFSNRIRNKKLMWALFEALARIGDPRAVAPMTKIVASGNEHLTARAMVCLGRMGDPQALDVLLPALSSPYMRPALFALARIGDARALESVTALVSKRFGAPEKLIYERLMLDALRSRCGEPVTLDNTRFALKCVEGNKYERVELHETAIELLTHHLEGNELHSLLTPVLDAEENTIRHAARMALGQDGKAAPVTFYDRGTVDAIFAQQGAEGLRGALRDPQGAQRHNIVLKAIDEKLGTELEADLIAYARELLTFEHGTCGYSDKWERKVDALSAIAKMGGEAADRLAYDALIHPNYMIRAIYEHGSRDIIERLRRFGPLEQCKPQPVSGKALSLTVTPLGKTGWSLGGMVNGMRFSADGQRLIAVGGQGGAGGAASIFNRAGEEILALPQVRGWAYDIDIHPDGKIAAMGLHAGHLFLVDLQTGEVLIDLDGHRGVPNGVRKVRFSPDGSRLASASDDETLIIWDVATRSIIRRVSEKFDVNTVDWFPDGRRVVFGTDKQIGIVNLTDENAEIQRADIGGIAEVRVFANGTRIAAGGSTKKGIVILDETMKILRTFDQRHVARIRFSKDESQMFAVSWEGEHLVRCWDMATGEATLLSGYDDAALFALDLDPVTGEPYAGGKKNVILSWDTEGKLRDANSNAHAAGIEDLLPLGGDELLSTAYDGAVIRWSLKDEAAKAVYRFVDSDGSPMRFKAVAVSPDGNTLLATHADGAIAFRAQDGTELWRQTLGRSEIALGIEGAFIAGTDQALAWLDAGNGELLHVEAIGKEDWAEHLLPLSGNRAIVAAYREPQAHLYDLVKRQRLASVELPKRMKKAETCSLATGGGKLVISRWDYSFDMLDAESLQHRFEEHNGVYADPMALSPDGMLVACGENELHLFDAETFDLLAREALGAKITTLCFVSTEQIVAGLGNGQLVSIRIRNRKANEIVQ